MYYTATVFARVRGEINPYTLRRGSRDAVVKTLEEIFSNLASRFGDVEARRYFQDMLSITSHESLRRLVLPGYSKREREAAHNGFDVMKYVSDGKLGEIKMTKKTA